MKEKAKRFTYTFEYCNGVAKKYEYSKDFKKNEPKIYNACVSKGFLKKFYWLKKLKRDLSYEYCYEIASRYETLKEFTKNEFSVYFKSSKNKWLKDYWWLKRSDFNIDGNIDNVYCYYFPNKVVYVGRSVEPERRNSKHKSTKDSAVHQYATENNLPIPEMTILESNITLKEGLRLEDYYVRKFKEDGYIVLNKAKTGEESGALGTISHGKYTKKHCYKCAKQCETLKEFSDKYNGEYQKSLRKKWLKDYYWLKRRVYDSTHVLQFTKSGEFVREWPSAREIERELGFSQCHISQCCLGKRKSAYKYLWKYKKEDD